MKTKHVNKIFKDMVKELSLDIHNETTSKVIYKYTKKTVEYIKFEKFKSYTRGNNNDISISFE